MSEQILRDTAKASGLKYVILRYFNVAPYKSGNVCFTSNPDGTIYIIYLAAPGESTMPASVEVRGYIPGQGSILELLGYTGKLKWKKGKDANIFIEIPGSLQKTPPCSHAWTFRIQEK